MSKGRGRRGELEREEDRDRAQRTWRPSIGWRAALSWPHLIALGVGAIVGTGILTLTGVGAAKAGPAVILSFAIAGLICAAAALAYAEMATMIPASGSAYTYTYVVLGELLAWIVGWSLILEYSLVVSAVAVGWSGYAVALAPGLGGFPDRAVRRGRSSAASSTCRRSSSSRWSPACSSTAPGRARRSTRCWSR